MPAGVYLHIPFCRSRCSYCDFATDIFRSESDVERYVEALRIEINAFNEVNPTSEIQNSKSLDTIYFGGGTPSLLTPDQVRKILTIVRDTFSVAPDAEITMEMNPATVTPETLRAYRSLGVNRASFGVQTFNDRALKLLARRHDANDARETYKMLRDAGYENISFDLIAGLPGQTLRDWERNLDEAIGLSPEHISLYLLEIHEGTPLAEQVRSGRRPPTDDDLAARMYSVMCERLEREGYRQYEISNFAKAGCESRHNTKYWRLEPVFGYGVSAHSFDGRQRYSNERQTSRYVDAIEAYSSAEVMRENVDASSEFIFLGLRMNEGIDTGLYQSRFGKDLISEYRSELDELTALSLIEIGPGRIALTHRGRLFSNEVFERFI